MTGAALFWWRLSPKGPEGHAGLSQGLVPYTFPTDAMKGVIVLWCCLDVAELLRFRTAFTALNECAFIVKKIFTLLWGPSMPRNYKVVTDDEFQRDHIRPRTIFKELQLSLG